MKTSRQINAERKKEGKPPLNFALFRKVIKRIENKPETYTQSVYFQACRSFNLGVVDDDDFDKKRPEPICGSVECIAGEGIICSAPTLSDGIRRLRKLACQGDVRHEALKLFGLDHIEARILFDGDLDGWPDQFRTQFLEAKTYRGQARAAIRYLTYIIRTGKVLE